MIVGGRSYFETACTANIGPIRLIVAQGVHCPSQVFPDPIAPTPAKNFNSLGTFGSAWSVFGIYGNICATLSRVVKGFFFVNRNRVKFLNISKFS
jgi:hypothetical protein